MFAETWKGRRREVLTARKIGRGDSSRVGKAAKTDEFDVTGLRNSRIRGLGNTSTHVHQNDNGFPAAPTCPNRG